MEETFWKMLVDYKIAEYYYKFYAEWAEKWRIIVSCICALASAACVVTWYQTSEYKLFLGAAIVIAQLISVCQPFFLMRPGLGQPATYMRMFLIWF